jgi:NADPH:quinone reductase-like Zn-dependent oxidoreductase
VIGKTVVRIPRLRRAAARAPRPGKLRPTIAGTFPLADAAEAHALGDTGRTAGKLVLLID